MKCPRDAICVLQDRPAAYDIFLKSSVYKKSWFIVSPVIWVLYL